MGRAVGEDAVAAQRALQMIGVVGLGRPPVDGHPDRGHDGQRRDEGGQQEPGPAAHGRARLRFRRC